MRKPYILLVLPLLIVGSCSLKDLDYKGGDGIKVNLTCGSLTKAGTAPGVDQYNENKLTDAWVFLFPSGALQGDGSAVATFWRKVSLGTTSGAASFSLNPTLRQVEDEIFPSGATSCDIFVLANYKGSETFASAPSLSSIRSLSIETDFLGPNQGANPDPTANFKVQDDFVMTGSGTVSLDRSVSPYSGSCTLGLKRLASKVELSIHVAQEITNAEGVVWVPNYSAIDIRIINAKSKGLVGGTPYTAGTTKQDKGFFDYYRRYGTAGELDGETRASVGPFYSYSNSWTDPFASESTYAELVVPFSIKDAQTTTYSYYKYKIRLLTGELEPNKWYTQRVNISLLGALHQGEEIPEISDNTFFIRDWSDVSTSIVINDNRYLQVLYSGSVSTSTTNEYNTQFGISANLRPTVVMLDNLDEVAIAYSSSPDVSLVSVEKYYYDFSGNTASRVTAAGSGAGSVTSFSGTGTAADHWVAGFNNAGTPRPVEVWLSNGNINIKHTLDNRDSDSDNSYDVSAFYLKLHVRHYDLDSDSQEGTYSDIYIVQKPAISIEADYTGATHGTSGACVSVNNGNNVPGTNGTSDGQNTNFNQYVISISRLNSESTYLIADPRVDRENAVPYWTNSASSKYISGYDSDGNPIISSDARRLQFYRETRSESTENMIALSFRFASSHGATTNINEQNAKYRCATYQENGCPAGRWRLPTVAEVKFAMSLSANGMIPYLFGSESNSTTYWVAGGCLTIDRSTNPATISDLKPSTLISSGPVRCVYDEWYWKDKLTDTQKTTFTWGDMQ